MCGKKARCTSDYVGLAQNFVFTAYRFPDNLNQTVYEPLLAFIRVYI